jgi:hypothetical protein
VSINYESDSLFESESAAEGKGGKDGDGKGWERREGKARGECEKGRGGKRASRKIP